MKKKLTMVVSLLLVMALSIGGTLAYLTAQTETVTNTFTIGNITLSLKEYDAEGVEITAANRTFKIIPGTEVAKNPKLTVTKGSEECYVYALVENSVMIGENVVATPDVDTTTNWTVIETEVVDGITRTLYKFNTTVDVLDASNDWTESVFTKVTYSEDITEETIDQLNGKTITIEGFAHQTAGVNDATADAAAIEHFDMD